MMQANSNTKTSPSIGASRALLTTPLNTALASPSDISSNRLVELDLDASQTAWLEDLSSSEPGNHDLCGRECLALRQVDAVSALTPYHEDRAAVWVQSAGREVLPDSSNAAQPLHATSRPGPVDRSIVPPSPYTQLTTQIMPGTSWTPGNSTQGQTPAAETISMRFCGPTYGSARRQALLSTLDDDEYYTNLSSAPPLIDDDPQTMQASIHPSWSELTPIPTITSNVQRLPQNYLGGIGAWQAGSIPGSTNTPSPASTRAHTDDLEPRVYYPKFLNV